jgi:hypothetical protein
MRSKISKSVRQGKAVVKEPPKKRPHGLGGAQHHDAEKYISDASLHRLK